MRVAIYSDGVIIRMDVGLRNLSDFGWRHLFYSLTEKELGGELAAN